MRNLCVLQLRKHILQGLLLLYAANVGSVHTPRGKAALDFSGTRLQRDNHHSFSVMLVQLHRCS
jgi:hypothetical protein